MKILRNALAIVVGFLTGNIVNAALARIGPQIIPWPAGVDATNQSTFAATLHLLEPRHFVFPFLAHALGSLVGALLTYVLAGSHQALFARITGALFLAGGIVTSRTIPTPTWFMVLDLAVAYLPMAWAGIWLGRRIRKDPV